MMWLERAIASREFFSIFIRAFPAWSGLEAHPRFHEVLDRAGLPWEGPR